MGNNERLARRIGGPDQLGARGAGRDYERRRFIEGEIDGASSGSGITDRDHDVPLQIKLEELNIRRRELADELRELDHEAAEIIRQKSVKNIQSEIKEKDNTIRGPISAGLHDWVQENLQRKVVH